MDAIARYAKQANDDELEMLARRIRGRAVLRMGQILKSIGTDQAGRPPKNHTAGGTISQTRTQAAEEAGVSKRQADTAKRVAALHETDPERAGAMIESGESVTTMANAGTKKRPIHLEGRDSIAFNRIIHWVGAWERAARELTHEPDLVASLTDRERARLYSSIETIRGLGNAIIQGNKAAMLEL